VRPMWSERWSHRHSDALKIAIFALRHSNRRACRRECRIDAQLGADAEPVDVDRLLVVRSHVLNWRTGSGRCWINDWHDGPRRPCTGRDRRRKGGLRMRLCCETMHGFAKLVDGTVARAMLILQNREDYTAIKPLPHFAPKPQRRSTGRGIVNLTP
jgi:hypothetical protein